MDERKVTVAYVSLPARRMFIRRGILSTDYFSYCEEVGCAVWEELARLPGRLDEPAFVTLPARLVKAGTSCVGVAAEVPPDYRGTVPAGCDVIELPEQEMVLFQGEPYREESWYGCAHDELNRAMAAYDPAADGRRYALDAAPQYQFSATAAGGVKAMKPVARPE